MTCSRTGAPALEIAAVGDIMLDRTVGERYAADPARFALEDFGALFAQHDLVIANLENPVSVRGTPYPRQDPRVTFCAHPRTLTVLRNLGVSAVTLANNHMLDYGPMALADTVEHLTAAGIPFVGAGRDYEEANRPLVLEVNGHKVGLIGRVLIYSASTARAKRRTPGVADYRMAAIVAQIRDLARVCSAVIVTVHWGLEYSFYPLQHLQRQARQMIEAGATLILGHGPHYVQGIERYRDGAIVYSMGNFIFDEPQRFSNLGFVFSGTILDRSVPRFSVHPFQIRDGVPRLWRSASARRLETLVLNLDRIYARKPRRFWQNLSDRYFSDIVRRVVGTRSPKFLFVPPARFYAQVGLRNYVAKLKRLLMR